MAEPLIDPIIPFAAAFLSDRKALELANGAVAQTKYAQSCAERRLGHSRMVLTSLLKQAGYTKDQILVFEVDGTRDQGRVSLGELNVDASI